MNESLNLTTGDFMAEDLVKLSKFLSYVLRHHPDSIGLSLNDEGWASITELLEKANVHGKNVSHADLMRVVAENDKQRFRLSDDGLMIRASQGHSIQVDLALSPQQPPAFLYHGTATRFLNSILVEGLKAKSRQQVHLSENKDTALKVGQRHGKPVILEVAAMQMAEQGLLFYLSDNGVWLTESVEVRFLRVL